jgi:hypothetical protein
MLTDPTPRKEADMTNWEVQYGLHNLMPLSDDEVRWKVQARQAASEQQGRLF